MRTPTAVSILTPLALAGLLAGCGTQGTGLSSNSWACTVLSEEQYFQGFGESREQAFQSAMDNCNLNAAQASACMGDPQKCMPPKGGS